MSLRKQSFDEAKAAFKPLQRSRMARKADLGSKRPSSGLRSSALSRDGKTSQRATGLKRGVSGRRAKPKKQVRLRAKPDPELVAWSLRVRKRDENRCQWPDCEFCRGSQDVTLDSHHKALRSARPDLRYVDSNGVTVCRRRHNWIHSEDGRDEAIDKGFLNLRSMELARLEGTLGVV